MSMTPDQLSEAIKAIPPKKAKGRKPKADKPVVDKPVAADKPVKVKKAAASKKAAKPAAEKKSKGGRKPAGEDAYELPRGHAWHKVLDAVPSRTALAAHLKTTPQGIYAALLAVSQGKRVRPDWVLALAGLAGVKPHAIRPDLYLKDWDVPPYGINEAGNKVKAPKA